MRKPYEPIWISAEFWGCRHHIPCAKIPAVQGKCWYCGIGRPPIEKGQKLPPPQVFGEKVDSTAKKAASKATKEAHAAANTNGYRVTECAWKECRNPSADNSKYCSRQCSNKNARSRHVRAHKKAEPVQAEG